MRIALAVVAAVAVLAGASAAALGFELQSWSDLDHGWAASGGTLYSTSDGGRTWRPIFYGGNQTFRIQQTSATAGSVLAGGPKVVAFWTRDGGRHWYRGNDAIGNGVGHGGLLFWTDGATLLQLKPWPPRGTVRCHGVWWATAFGPSADARLPKNVCGGTAPISERSDKVLTLAHGEFAPDALISVPAGVAGVSTDGSARQRPLEVAVYRSGQALETALPNPFPPDTGFSGLRLAAAWPHLTLQAEAGTTHAVWTSDDGGATWTLIGGPAAARG